MRNAIRRAIVPLILPLMAAPASAELRYENQSGGHVLLYGHLNPTYQSFDDGFETTEGIVDNGHSNSRAGFWVRQPFGDNEFRFNFETALGFRQSFAVSQNVTPQAFRWQRTNLRRIDFSLKTDAAGTFSAGQGSMATDGAAEIDLSGTALALYTSIQLTAGGFFFRETDGTLSNRRLSQAFNSFDGGRRARIRYDTPTVAGFHVSAAYGQEVLAQNSDLTQRDIALRYSKTFGDTRVRGAIGYSRTSPGNGGEDINDTIGSVSVRLGSGLNFTVTAGDRSTAGSYAYGKVGYIGEWFDFGTTAVAVDFYDGDDQTTEGSQSRSYGFGVVQRVDSASLEIYLAVRHYDLEEPDASFEDARSILFGSRWRF